VKTNDIYRRMTVPYGDNGMNEEKVYKWVEIFKGARMSVADDACSGPREIK
jgi:hypothetical protein